MLGPREQGLFILLCTSLIPAISRASARRNQPHKTHNSDLVGVSHSKIGRSISESKQEISDEEESKNAEILEYIHAEHRLHKEKLVEIAKAIDNINRKTGRLSRDIKCFDADLGFLYTHCQGQGYSPVLELNTTKLLRQNAEDTRYDLLKAKIKLLNDFFEESLIDSAFDMEAQELVDQSKDIVAAHLYNLEETIPQIKGDGILKKLDLLWLKFSSKHLPHICWETDQELCDLYTKANLQSAAMTATIQQGLDPEQGLEPWGESIALYIMYQHEPTERALDE